MHLFKPLTSLLISQSFCDDTRKIPVCKSSQIPENSISQVTIGRKRILLIRLNNVLYALSPRCPHQSADLSAGFLKGFNLVCPMHGAEFDIRTGSMSNPPGFKSLHSYPVSEDSGQVFITLDAIREPHAQPGPQDPRTFAIVGAGAAGMSAAGALRKSGFAGKIVILSNEQVLPYDRVLLSKNLFLTPDSLRLFAAGHFAENSLELRLNSKVDLVTPDHVALADGSKVPFDKVLICTGARAKVPSELIESLAYKNFLTMRSFEDYSRIRDQVKDKTRICVIGNRFLGLELVASIRKSFEDKEVVFIEYEREALAKVVGKFLYDEIFKSMRDNGVRVVTGEKILTVENDGSCVRRVVTETQEFDAEVFIVSTGSSLPTEHVPDELKGPDGAVKVDAHMRTKWDQVYAAGDIAEFDEILTGSRQRIEHWVVAQQQGVCAGRNMAGVEDKFEAIPYFWSEQFDFIEMAGFCFGASQQIDEGAGKKKISYFFRKGKCIGVAAINMPMVVLKLKSLMAKELMPSYEDFINRNITSEDLLLMFKGCQNCKKF